MNGLFEWSFLGAAVGATATDGVEGPFGAVLGDDGAARIDEILGAVHDQERPQQRGDRVERLVC